MQLVAIIMRGLPGSGKSYWVEQYLKSLSLEAGLAAKQRGYFSTDSYFYQQGHYCFDKTKLSQYHQLNLTGFIHALSRREPVVICDNTNLAHWEYSAYEAAAKALGYQVRQVVVGDPLDIKHQQLCAKRNQHGLNLAQIKRMATVFEAG